MSGCKGCKDCKCPDDEDTLDEPLPVRYVYGGKLSEPDLSEVKAPTDDFAIGDDVYVPGEAFGDMVPGEVVGKTYRQVKVRLANGIIRLFEPQFVEKVVIAFLLFFLSVTGCAPVDYGRLTTPEGRPLCPVSAPLAVVSSDALLAEVDEATAWWSAELFPEVPFMVVVEGWETATVQVRHALLPPSRAGEAVLEWGCYEGGACVITEAEVFVQSGLEEGLLQPALRHELGHCLGLADDDAGLTPVSIMQSPAADGVLTDRDRALLLRGCE